jgi:hypothetical protein
MKKLLIAMSVALIAAVATPNPALAGGVTVYENGDTKVKIFGDMRMRMEADTTTQTGKSDKDRQRHRIRLRFGTAAQLNDVVTLGWRVATGAEANHSTHHNLGMVAGGSDGGSFGLDQGYIKLNLKPAWLWMGKYKNIVWDPMSMTWDSDAQPEGIAAGATFGDIWVSAAWYQLSFTGWDNANDTMLAYQVGGSFGGDVKVKLALGGYAVSDQEEDKAESAFHIPGGEAAYNHVMAEVSAKELPLSPVVGIGYVSSTVDDKYIGDGAESADKNAMVVWAKAKVVGYGVSLAYHDIGYAGATALGTLTQDDFPYTNNYTGYVVAVSRAAFDKKLKVGLKYFFQKTKNENIGPEAYDAMLGKGKERTRIQLNFDVNF